MAQSVPGTIGVRIGRKCASRRGDSGPFFFENCSVYPTVSGERPNVWGGYAEGGKPGSLFFLTRQRALTLFFLIRALGTQQMAL